AAGRRAGPRAAPCRPPPTPCPAASAPRPACTALPRTRRGSTPEPPRARAPHPSASFAGSWSLRQCREPGVAFERFAVGAEVLRGAVLGHEHDRVALDAEG